jgi:hypothetical protein
MKKKSFRFFPVIVMAVLGVILSLSSCEMSNGLGSEVDLEAPHLTITSPKNLEFVGAGFTVTGTCQDNVKVTRVVVEDLYYNREYSAVVSGNTWSLNLNLEPDENASGSVEVSLRATAYDAVNNTSFNSVKQITVKVDLTPPLIGNVTIRRDATTTETSLKPLDDLKNMDRENYANVDYFQNESFSIKGELEYGFALEEKQMSLILRGEDGKDWPVTVPHTGDSNYSPLWTITHAMINAWNPAFAVGEHYFQVIIRATNNTGKTQTKYGDWFCWSVNADRPHIGITAAAGGLLAVALDGIIQIDTFDDDRLDAVYAYLVPREKWTDARVTQEAQEGRSLSDEDMGQLMITNIALRNSLLYKKGNPINPGLPAENLLVNVGPKRENVTIDELADFGVTANGEYRLVVLARDKKTDTSEGVWRSRVFITVVADTNAPIIVVENPKENTVPGISGGKFSLSGYTVDNNGVQYIRIAWVPNGLPGTQPTKIAWAQNALQANRAPESGDLGYGIKIFDNIVQGAPTDEVIVPGQAPFKKRSFTHEFDVLNEFKYNGETENATRLFVIYAHDGTTGTFRDFRLLANTGKPVITVSDPEQPSKVHGVSADLKIVFTAGSPAGLDLTTVKLEDITAVPQDITPVPDGQGVYRFTVPKATLAGKVGQTLRYQITATDALGNTSTESREILLTDLPVLRRITSGMADASPFKKGDTITIQAVFSDPVKVEGNPRIKLRYSDIDTVDKYADYVSGSNSSTLTFSFTVPVDAVSAGLRSFSTPIDLPGGARIYVTREVEGVTSNPDVPIGTLGLAESLQHFKIFKIDAVAPTIAGVKIVSDTASYTPIDENSD